MALPAPSDSQGAGAYRRCVSQPPDGTSALGSRWLSHVLSTTRCCTLGSFIHHLHQTNFSLPPRPTPHPLLQTGIASPVQDCTNFLRAKPLEHLVAPAVYMCSLVGVVFQDDISLID